MGRYESSADKLYNAADTSCRIQIPGMNVQRFTLPAYGLIERIEIHPAEGLLPNVDSAALYTMDVRLVGPNGDVIPCGATLVARDVEAPE